MSLLRTEQGKVWFNQFDNNDQSLAIQLVNNLTLVSLKEFERAIKTLIPYTEDSTYPIALYPSYEMQEGRQFFLSEEAIAPLPEASEPGSEGRVAHIITAMCRKNKKVYLNRPNLGVLRNKKCKKIYIFDDFIGSGNTVISFLDAFWKSKTIKSWLSGGFIEFHVLSYSGTENALRKVCMHPTKPKVTYYKHFDCIDKNTDLKDLCERYAKKIKDNKKHPLGYGEAGSLIIFEHGCPNNAPKILWVMDKKWHSLFPGRSILPEQADFFRDAKFNLKKAKNIINLSLSKDGKKLLLLLQVLSRGVRKIKKLSLLTGYSVIECEELISKCINWEFITEDYNLTASGRAELEYIKLIKPKKLPLVTDQFFYYPTALRGSDEFPSDI